MYLGWKGRCHVWGAHSEHRVKHMLCGRISQPQHYWHLGLDDYLFWEAALDTVECLAASLASTHWMLVLLSSCDNQTSLQTLISVPKELESLSAENCCSVGKRVSRKIGSGCRSGKISWRRVWQPTLVVLPRESHGQRSLVSYSPRGCLASDATEETQNRCTEERCSAGKGRDDAPYLLL